MQPYVEKKRKEKKKREPEFIHMIHIHKSLLLTIHAGVGTPLPNFLNNNYIHTITQIVI